MPKTVTRVGPEDNGRRMSLEEFAPAIGQPGYVYELARGVVVVADIPNPPHFRVVMALKRAFYAHDLTHPGQIHGIAAGSECKILLRALESERHPDVAVYKTPPPAEGEEAWETWAPEIVADVVSPGSEQRDYVEKREEYLLFGVREYWVVDPGKEEMLVLRRLKGRWSERVVRAPKVYRTRLLPGFELDVGRVFAADRAAGR
jgi:Uma2 family endonuclease